MTTGVGDGELSTPIFKIYLSLELNIFSSLFLCFMLYLHHTAFFTLIFLFVHIYNILFHSQTHTERERGFLSAIVSNLTMDKTVGSEILRGRTNVVYGNN